MHDRLDPLAARLAALPGYRAPAGVWQAVLAADRAPQPAAGPRLVAPAMAAAALLAVAGLAWLAARGPAMEPAVVAMNPISAALDAARARNVRLEELLAALPSRSAIRGSTAYTVTLLEDRLAEVDERLTMAALEPAATARPERLWQEREELLNSLVQVRIADVASAL